MSESQQDQQQVQEWLDRGLAALAESDVMAAQAAFDEARRLAPREPDAYLNLGSLAQLQQDHEQAIRWYGEALMQAPTNWQARYCRGLAYAALAQWEEALADLDEVLRGGQAPPDPYLNRGYVLRALGRLAEARQDFQTFLDQATDPQLKQQAQIWLDEIASVVEDTPEMLSARLQRARQAYLAGDGATALRHYHAVIEEAPTHREALLARAHLYAVMEQPEAARADLALLLDQYPDDGELWYHQAVLQRRWQDREGAHVSLARALNLTPDLPEAHVEQAQWALESYPQEALASLSEALRLDPHLAQALLLRAGLQRRMGHELLAIADYRQVLQIDSTLVEAYEGIDLILQRFSARIASAPDQTRPYIARANLYQQLGRLEDALHDWGEALRLDPDNALLLAGRAQVLAEQQQYPTAHAEYTKAIELAPDQAGFYFERAQVLVPLMRHGAALADLDRAISLAPEKGSYYILRGTMYAQLDQPEEALRDLDQAIQLSPARGDAWRERARLHLIGQRLPEALADYQRAVALSPDVDLHRDCAAVSLALGQQAMALDHLNQALRLNPHDLEALLERSELHLKQNSFTRALEDLNLVLKQEPNWLMPWVLRAKTYVQLEEWEAAASDASRALVRDAAHWEAYYLRGISYFELGTYEQAARDLRRYLQQMPQAPHRERVLRLIRLADDHQLPRRRTWWRRR